MNYDAPLYRPPSEARSLILQLTLGCSHNKCTFCSMYKDKKFKILTDEEIENHLSMAKLYYPNAKKLFIADGNALAIPFERLCEIFKKIKIMWPSFERITLYGAPKDILRRSISELEILKSLGLEMIYMGLESGSDLILKEIEKGVTSSEMIEAGRRVDESGISLSLTMISGLGGKAHWKEHALESAKVINSINPSFLGLLTLMVEDGTKLKNDITSNKFELLSADEVLEETLLLLENLDVNNTVFRSNHASNYTPLRGTLPQDKLRLIEEIKQAILTKDIKPEWLRGL